MLTIGIINLILETDSESVQLQLILGGENRNHPVQVQMASMNLCEHETIRMKLGGRKTDNDHKCHVKKNDPYLLSGIEFFVPRLMPTVSFEIHTDISTIDKLILIINFYI